MTGITRKRPADPSGGGIGTDDAIGERIVAAAAEAIIESGFGGATTEAIARAAKTSKRSIYERFPDRNALFEHVMAWLCSEAGDKPASGSDAGSLRDCLHSWGFAVLYRFAHPRGRRVLMAAIGASTTFPAALEIFWTCGPGQAVEAIADRLDAAQAAGGLRRLDARAEARSFLLACCGPVVLDQLFEPDPEPDSAALERHVAHTAGAFLVDWSAG